MQSFLIRILPYWCVGFERYKYNFYISSSFFFLHYIYNDCGVRWLWRKYIFVEKCSLSHGWDICVFYVRAIGWCPNLNDKIRKLMSKAQLYDWLITVIQSLNYLLSDGKCWWNQLYYSTIISLTVVNWESFSVLFMKKRFEKQMKINKKSELTWKY